MAKFTALCAHGLLNQEIAPYLASANLIPLRKPDNGVPPIAIRETLRRMVGKVLMSTPSLAAQLKNLAPLQCGVGIPNACESIGQGLQNVVSGMPVEGDWVVLQIDLSNAFNCVDRTTMLKGAARHAGNMYPWLKFLKEQPTTLYCQGRALPSRTGVHQGCPLGPAAFAVGIGDGSKCVRRYRQQNGACRPLNSRWRRQNSRSR